MALNLLCSIQKSLTASEAIGAGQGWAGVPASASKASKDGGSVQPTALFKSKFRSILRFSTLVEWYLTLVGHTQSQVCHLRSAILKVHIDSVICYGLNFECITSQKIKI